MALLDEEDDETPRIPVYDEDDPGAAPYRWMSTVIVLLALAGFFGLAWYAYRNGGDTADERDVELIKADGTPIKEAPNNPGGMEIPNQDKTVYGLISGKGEKPVVERILPLPEEPVARGEAPPAQNSAKPDNAMKTDKIETVKPEATAPAKPAEQFMPKLHADGTPQAVQQTATPQPDASAKPSAAASVRSAAQPPSAPASAQPADNKAESKTVTAPQKQAQEDADDNESETEAAPAASPPVAKIPPVKAAATVSSGGVRAQLGAYKSEAEANGDWSRISRKFGEDLQGKQHYVVKADLGAKGIYYRLQLAPFASARDAESFCVNLLSSGQGCMAAKGK